MELTNLSLMYLALKKILSKLMIPLMSLKYKNFLNPFLFGKGSYSLGKLSTWGQVIWHNF